MPQISTDKKKINELLVRGVEHIYPSKEFLQKRLEEGKQLTLYTGYDPTAPTLHIGHGITFLKLRQFQELGHKIIMLIGDFTGMIGDPTDKTSARVQLTHTQTRANCRRYKKQAGAILNFGGGNPADVRFNSAWLSRMKFADVLKLASHFTVQRMLERDMFEERTKGEKPIYLHEFLYPVMQAYDSVFMQVDGEVGGNDQTFNMLAGRHLQKEIAGKEKFVLTTRLLADPSGAKMGKSEGNMIALSDAPEDMFGKVMSWTDDMIIPAFELCTRVPLEDVQSIARSLRTGANPRDSKLLLAKEIVAAFLGSRAAQKGQAHFIATFQKKSAPQNMPHITPSSYDVLAVLVESHICKSKSSARQVIDQGGVKVNNQKVPAKAYGYAVRPGSIVQKGSRWFVKVE